MKRSAHILLALVAGILLKASLPAFGAEHPTDASAKLGFRLIDRGSAGSLLDPDRPDAPQPYVGGASPKLFSHASQPTAILPAAKAGTGRLTPDPSPVSLRPVYLTTLRIRL